MGWKDLRKTKPVRLLRTQDSHVVHNNSNPVSSKGHIVRDREKGEGEIGTGSGEGNRDEIPR